MIPKRSKDANTNRAVISGPDDNIWIKNRQAWPCAPDYSLPNIFPDAANDVRSGTADEVIKGFVSANCTPAGWDAERAVPRLTVAPVTGIGSAITTQARFDILSDIVNAAALAGGDIGWNVTDVRNVRVGLRYLRAS